MSQSESKPKSRRVLSAAIKFIIALVILFFAAIFVQRQLRPDIDPARTKPIVVERHDTSVVNESLNLPDGAVTATINQQVINDAEHPFDPLLKVAEASIAKIDESIRDYKATLVSQVFVDGVLQPEKYLECKIRHKGIEGAGDTQKEIPFSVYTLFLKPEENAGQEAIWVDGWHQGNLVAHATGFLNVKRAYLDPEGAIAMRGNRYPIREIGIRNLIVKMAEIGNKDRQHGECEVTIKRNVDINGCQCTLLQAVHPVQRDHFEFHIARIYIDDARNIPIAYEGYLWPEKEGDEPPLLEKYYYTDIEINVGLTDADFDPANEAYNYPAW